MLKIVEEVTTVYRVLDAADRLIRELPTLIEAEAFKLGFEEATPAYEDAPEPAVNPFFEDAPAEEISVADNTRPAWFSEQAAEEVAVALSEQDDLDAEVFEDTEPLVTNGSAETIEV